MPLSVEEVTTPRTDTRRLPDALTPGALLLAELTRDGVLARLAEALPLSRQGGHCSPNLLAFALVLLAAGPAWSLRPFYERFRQSLARVAAIAGLSDLPSSSSMGRFLRALDTPTVEAFTDAVLTHLPGIDALLSNPSVQHRDRMGCLHHIVDIDPSPQAFRQRDLVEGDDRPRPKRRAPGVPGYKAHHRGELRIQHIPCQHAGSGLWLGYRLRTGHGGTSSLVSALTAAVRARLLRLGDTLSLLMRGDQEFGSAGVAGAIVAQGAQVLVRLARYAWLDQEVVVERMASGHWLPVSTTTRRRKEALDLGLFLLHPDEDSEDAGKPPVWLRVVVSRQVCEGKPDKGVKRGAYQLELFGTTLSVDGFDAADVVSLYGGRSCIENGFSCEDRELGLGRTFSYHVAGQQWMVAVGLWLWNWFTVRGVHLLPLPEPPLPTGEETVVQNKEPTPLASVVAPTEATGEETVVQNEEPTPLASVVAPTEQQEGGDSEEDGDSEAGGRTSPFPLPPEAGPSVAVPPVLLPTLKVSERQELVGVLKEAFSDMLQQPGWSLDEAQAVLRCPQQQRLQPFCVAAAGKRRSRPQLLVRTDRGACDGCPLRQSCFPSPRPHIYKQVARTVSQEQAHTVETLLKAHRSKLKVPPAGPAAPTPPPGPVPAAPSLPPAPWQPLPTTPPGPYPVQPALFLPAAARQRYREHLDALWVEVTLGRARRQDNDHPLLARTAAHKSRLRRTWTERNDRWRTDRSVYVRIQRRPT